MKMPKAKNKTTRPDPEEESDEDYEASTQSFTQAEKHIRSMTVDDIDRKVTEVVQYILVADQKKLPIKRHEITKHVLKEHSKAFPKIIEKAVERLKKVFGFKLVEVEGKVTRYILVNNIEEEEEPSRAHLSWTDEDTSKMGLLTLILTAIFMKGDVMGDGELYQMLKKLGVDVERQHEVFGDVKKLVTQEFVRQLYLEYERIPKSEPPAYNFMWGQRAVHELKRGSCLDLVCEVYGTPHEAWASQYEYVVKREGKPRGGQQESNMVNGENEENVEPRPGPSRGGRNK